MASLLEEERDFVPLASITNSANPCGGHRACACAGLATDDDPMNTGEVELAKQFERRFNREEPHACGVLAVACRIGGGSPLARWSRTPRISVVTDHRFARGMGRSIQAAWSVSEIGALVPTHSKFTLPVRTEPMHVTGLASAINLAPATRAL